MRSIRCTRHRSESEIAVKIIAADSDKLFRFAGGQCDHCSALFDFVGTRRHYPIFERAFVRATRSADHRPESVLCDALASYRSLPVVAVSRPSPEFPAIPRSITWAHLEAEFGRRPMADAFGI